MSFYCPKCGNEFSRGTSYCSSCGCNLEMEFIENPVCPQCKTNYPANTKFCTHDGARLVRPEDLIPRCTICKTPYQDGSKFCPRDGGEIKVILPGLYQQPAQQSGEQSAYARQSAPLPKTGQAYSRASLGSRFFAALLDGLISGVLAIPALYYFVVALDEAETYYDEEAPFHFLLAFLFWLIPMAYNFIKDGLKEGQSFGKRAVDIMVVSLEDNSPCPMGKSILRNFVSAIISFIPFVGWLVEPIMVLATDNGRKLGDRAANTQVIEKSEYIKMAQAHA